MAQPDAIASETRSSDAPGRLWARWLIVFIGCFVLYSFTAARTIQWQDYGHFVLRILEGELFNELGLALAHPLHYWLCELLILVLPTEPAHAVALVSALAGAMTVANVFGCVVSVTRRLDAALVAAGGLSFANTFWRMSTMPECYTVTTALLSAEMWCLGLYFRSVWAGHIRAGWLIAAMLFNGLGLTNHNLALLTAPIVGAVLIYAMMHKHMGVSRFVLALITWVVGALPYLVLVVIEANHMGDVGGAIHSALFGNHYADQVMNAKPSLKQIVISSAFTVLGFFNLTLLFAAVGLWGLVRDRDRRGLWMAWGVALVIHVLFVLRYDVIDQHTFLLPAYTLIVLFAGVGYAAFVSRCSAVSARRVFVLSMVLVFTAPGVYLATASVARSQDALGEYARNKPYRDDYRYLFVPWGAGETSAQTMAQHAVSLAGDDGLILLGDGMARFAVKYTVRQAGMADIDVLVVRQNDAVDWPADRDRPIVFVPASVDDEPMTPPSGMVWSKDGPLYTLKPIAPDALQDGP